MALMLIVCQRDLFIRADSQLLRESNILVFESATQTEQTTQMCCEEAAISSPATLVLANEAILANKVVPIDVSEPESERLA